MSHADEFQHKADDAASQIARLREQVEMLMRDRITPAVSDMAGRAEAAVTGARDTVRSQAEMMSEQVRERPLTAILVALGVGWLLGRVTR